MCQQEIKDVVWNTDTLDGCSPAERANPTNKHIKRFCEDADAMYSHMYVAQSNELPDNFHTIAGLLLTAIGLPAGPEDPEDPNPLEDAAYILLLCLSSAVRPLLHHQKCTVQLCLLVYESHTCSLHLSERKCGGVKIQ
jgi:hypothetical protein